MVTLYSTEGCHLCELANNLCQQLNINHMVDIVDIALNDKLFERYGVTIPVLSINGNELKWQFYLQQLQMWLENN